MITLLNKFTYNYDMLINFIAHLTIFIGAFYVALQNRNLKQWHLTPLWYIGLTSVFVVFTIVCQWAIGPEYPISYWNLGRLAETLSNISVAAVALVMLIGTIRLDLKNSRKRRRDEQGEI
jgi:hypothetical protein